MDSLDISIVCDQSNHIPNTALAVGNPIVQPQSWQELSSPELHPNPLVPILILLLEPGICQHGLLSQKIVLFGS